jgi:DUF971 family protein
MQIPCFLGRKLLLSPVSGQFRHLDLADWLYCNERYNSCMPLKPIHLDLKKDIDLTIHWSDGRISVYPIAYLRRMSPSAETRKLREEMANNPLTVLPDNVARHTGRLEAVAAELVGNYALRIRFSDGHDTGIYSWSYLREIEPADQGAGAEGDGS